MRSIREVCPVKNCQRLQHSHKLCSFHLYRLRNYGDVNFTRKHEVHNLANTHIHTVWNNIKGRCFHDYSTFYDRYGGRGITMCNRWRYSLIAFNEDMGKRPYSTASIDRIDSNGNYSCGKCEQCLKNNWPMNCRWASKTLQVWNRTKMSVNTTGYIGVIKLKLPNRWAAQMSVTINGKRINYWFGTFRDIEEAALMYDRAVIFFRGYEAVTNYL